MEHANKGRRPKTFTRTNIVPKGKTTYNATFWNKGLMNTCPFTKPLPKIIGSEKPKVQGDARPIIPLGDIFAQMSTLLAHSALMTPCGCRNIPTTSPDTDDTWDPPGPIRCP